ncbi:FAD/NAD(P)-binding domain-containing protein [Penicillium atrosanguineum]|uniref:FAD/NAD(P)-binding domain-containing protein n=1 Tax=Penicillium atrosanguineum TaxID=1132637 RepID=A0A9W9GI37_9EURO|nr:uncharacterized protein N7443_008037 [Penicillium atrosanguineum]KAJ5119108.1 FAD/NAD(P)-binding domain-containing protein [Penicillium atrosanguineum]KAJ5120147.1 FAD/NAD(P)-binding domain-containing protein [Penicillium atrosanguineum]KAJ5297144.1 hypothetical protein N7443_008037 [Penicillium atrosanguineum]KAJ5299902.1 FAD/NAD(P)-binding domain-containing protein [Penicillium atrosanguineum]
MTNDNKLHIIIVGGGIAGLTAAIALRASNRKITVLEQSRLSREIGALISLQPNASRILRKTWKLDKEMEEARGLVDEGMRIYDVDGKLVNEIPLLSKTEYGGDRIVWHRNDLHTALKSAATSPNRGGDPATIQVASRVTSCDPVEGNVTLESGEVLTADVIIGADGIALRKYVLNDEPAAMPTGSSERMNEDPNSGESWVSEGSMEKMMEIFAEFPSWVSNIFKHSANIGLWQLRDMDPLATWVQGRVILIGDAAHPMLPTQGQGASQSIEDAEALGAFFEDVQKAPSLEQLDNIFKQVFQSRYERVSIIQGASRQAAKPGTKKGEKTVTMYTTLETNSIVNSLIEFLIRSPADSMDYNCTYRGAKQWVHSQAGSAV